MLGEEAPLVQELLVPGRRRSMSIRRGKQREK